MTFEMAVGASWGGLQAIEILLSNLPKDFPLGSQLLSTVTEMQESCCVNCYRGIACCQL